MQTSSRKAERWTPPCGDNVEMVEVGSHWDAVRAPVEIGERALELLGGATGAVIADYAQMYWLIVAGSAQYWRRLPQVQTLGAAPTSYIGVPPHRPHRRAGTALACPARAGLLPHR
ncbi:hypothetical protein GCM10009579_57140 [Streptomyces javensis]|uniref:Uncharacterized protein n=1 Tax=Streptomyces javensis TaxID=114698 RepID=A0ABN1X5P5_9ACTN